MSSADSNDYLNPSMHTPIAIESIEPRWPNKNCLADHPVLFGKVIRSYSRYLLCSVKTHINIHSHFVANWLRTLSLWNLSINWS